MRETNGLSFKAIADELVAEGYKAPRGGLLGAEIVFSIYKKGQGELIDLTPLRGSKSVL